MNANSWAIEPERYELFESSRSTLDWTRREFMRLVGGGIVIVLLRQEVLAQDPPRRGRGRGEGLPQDIDAWLHIAENEDITVYTGKVELGQNIRTSLSQAVAEELHVRPDRIRLVMADTQLTPFDMGTFGSQTTPMMGAQLRRVGAAARATLLDIAAENMKVTRERLSVEDGKVVESASGKSLSFGQLTKGQKLLKIIDRKTPLIASDQWNIAGTSVPKITGREFVTGGHQYTSDIQRKGMLFGRVLRPTAIGAKLLSADTKAAEAMDGVKVVREKEFVGVVAATQSLADQALTSIRAEWEESHQISSNELFEHLVGTKDAAQETTSSQPVGGEHVPDGISRKATYTIAYIAHAPLEPRAAVAEWDGDKLTIWTGTQRPFGVRSELSEALKMPEKSIRVIVPDTGSGYGGKHTGEAAVEAARLAKAAGKPVKFIWTRAEEFTWAYFRPAGVIEVTSAASKNGKLTHWELHNYNSGSAALKTPYDVPDPVHQFHRADSPLRQGSYRALAATANHFARETHMDELAHALRMDPLDFRLRNIKNERLRAVLEEAAKRFGWGKTKPDNGRGFGIAAGTEKGSYVAACAEVAAKAGEDAKVIRLVIAFECGAIVNPNHLKNQIEGAAIMGLGGALFEAIQFDNGKILNAAFAKYRVPRFSDVPAIDVVLLDRRDLPSAGAGETPIVCVAPAIGNAIFSAAGVRLRSLPMAPNNLPSASK